MMNWKMKSTANVETQEIVSHNHYNPPNYIEIATSIVFGVIALGALFWWGGVYLFSQMGVQNPRQAFAVSLGVGVGAMLLIAIFSGIGNMFIDKILLHRERMADKRLAEEELRARMRRSESVDKREVSRSNTRFNRLIEYLLEEMYAHGEYKTNDRRPWARRNAKSIVLANETQPVGEAMATHARNWLIDNQVIIGKSGKEVVNKKRYPDIASVERVLYNPKLYKVEQ